MGMPKHDRLLYILNLLRARKNLNAALIAVECGVTERSIYRDILTLSEANIPIYYDRGYKLASSNFLPPLNFNFEEYRCLKLALESSPLIQTGNHQNTLKQILAKVEAGLSPQVKSTKAITRDTTHIDITTSQAAPSNEEMFALIEQAINETKQLKITYDAIESGLKERLVEPYFIIFRGRAFYFVAFCHVRSLFRTFRLDRVRELELTEKGFIRQTDISAEDYFKGSWEVFSGDPVDVVVRFKGAAAKVVRGSHHHTDEEIEVLSDNELTYRVRVNGTHEILRWIIGFGDQAEVLSPDSIKSELKRVGQYLSGTY